MKRFSERQQDALALLLIFLLAVAFLHKVVFTGGVFLPADLLLVMNPWRHTARELFPDFERVQNPLLDVIQQYYPWRLYAVRTLRGGEIPLWNPHAFCGTPFVANLQSAIFYPLNLIFFLTSVGRGFGFSALLHLFLAGTFTYLLLRHWKLRRTAALLGAVTFMFNGYFIAWMEFPTISLWTGAWLPLILLLFDKSIEQRHIRWAVAAGVIVGIQFLGGHLNTSFYVLFGLTAYAAFRAVAGQRVNGSMDQWIHAIRNTHHVTRHPSLVTRHWSLTMLVGFALSAVQLLPTFELAQRSTRSVAHQYHEVVVNGLPLHHLITFLAPNFFGNDKDIKWWAGFPEVGTPLNFIETTGYVGVLPLAFALLAICFCRHRHVYFFAGLALFSLLIAMGTPLYAVFFYLVPGFKQLAAPARILYLLDFCLALLAAFGAEQLRHTPHATRHTQYLRFCFLFPLLALAALAAAVLEFPAFFFHEELYLYEIVQVGWSVVFIGAAVLVIGYQLAQRSPLSRSVGEGAGVRAGKAPWGIIAVAITVADLFLFGIHFNPVCDARILDVTPESVKSLRADRSPHRLLSLAPPGDAKGFLHWMPPNTPMIYELSDVQGSDSLVVKQYLDALRAVQPDAPTHDFRNVNAPFINLLNVKYVLTEASLDPAQWEVVSNDDVTVYRNRRVLPRAFLVSRMRVKRNRDDLLHALAQPDFQPEREVLLEEELPLETEDEAQGEARITRYRPNRAEIETRSAAPAVLVFSETWYAGWRAAVDGKPQRVLRANGALRAVALTAGEHKIAWAYHPSAFRLGAFWSLMAMACIGAVGVCGVIPRRATRGRRWTKTSSISSRT
jgi:hypothetical protein